MRARGRPLTSFSTVPDVLLGDTSLSLAARLVLAYIIGRPPHWVATVTDIQRTLGIPETTWRRLRDELRKAGVVPVDHPKRFGGGRNEFSWVLDVDLSRFWPGLSTTPPAKLADGSHPPFSMDGKRRINSSREPTEKTPPLARERARVDGGGREIQVYQADSRALSLAMDLGLGDDATARCARLAASATPAQLAILQGAIERARARQWEGIEDLEAWAKGMFKRAGTGALSAGIKPAGGHGAAAEPPKPSVETEARQRLAAMAGRRLVEPRPEGRTWEIEAGGHLRANEGRLLHPSDAARLLAKLDADELHLD